MTTPDPRPAGRLEGWVLAMLYVLASGAWMFFLLFLSTIALAVVIGPFDDSTAARMDEAIWNPWLLGPFTFLQMVGFGVLVAVFVRIGRRSWDRAAPWVIRGWRPLVAAAAAGLAIGGPTSMFAEQLDGLSWLSNDSLQGVGQALTQGDLLPRLMLMAAVTILAPIVEELMFRGLLWDALSDHLPPAGVFALTSVAFAAYHFDPLHSLAVFPVGLLLGWLRWRTGGIVAPMLAHFANNAVALGSLLVLGPEAEASVAWAIGGTLVVLAALGALVLLGPPEDPAASP